MSELKPFRVTFDLWSPDDETAVELVQRLAMKAAETQLPHLNTFTLSLSDADDNLVFHSGMMGVVPTNNEGSNMETPPETPSPSEQPSLATPSPSPEQPSEGSPSEEGESSTSDE